MNLYLLFCCYHKLETALEPLQADLIGQPCTQIKPIIMAWYSFLNDLLFLLAESRILLMEHI